MRLKPTVIVIAIVIALAFSMGAVADDSSVITIGMAETWKQCGLDYLEDVLIPKFEAERLANAHLDSQDR